jgi:glycosyltransferase involved in cell wall biosynthesis
LGERVLNILWYRLRVPLPLNLFIGTLDVFHSPNFLLPPLSRGTGLITVHDLSFLVVPQYAEPSLARYLGRALPRSIQRATLVLADSYSTKEDLVARLGVPPEKVEVVYGGVDPAFVPVKDEAVLAYVRRRYAIERPYILALGTLEPRKNLAGLLRAYALLRQEKGLEHRLLVAGGQGWLYQRLFDLVQELGLGKDVHWLGFVPEEDLPALLSLAEVFVYPSFYEGFGLPPLEAMACGVPVVASQAPCLPEVLGEAALFVDPQDPSAIAEAAYKVLADSQLRQALVAKGRAQVAKYTWCSAAERLLAVYRRAAQLAGGEHG